MRKVPVFKAYQGGWPIHDIARQFLANHVKRFNRDIEAEKNKKDLPDRKAIQQYLERKPCDSNSDDSGSEGDTEMESNPKLKKSHVKGKTRKAVDDESNQEDDGENGETVPSEVSQFFFHKHIC